MVSGIINKRKRIGGGCVRRLVPRTKIYLFFTFRQSRRCKMEQKMNQKAANTPNRNQRDRKRSQRHQRAPKGNQQSAKRESKTTKRKPKETKMIQNGAKGRPKGIRKSAWARGSILEAKKRAFPLPTRRFFGIIFQQKVCQKSMLKSISEKHESS